jgi:hypothetical protein
MDVNVTKLISGTWLSLIKHPKMSEMYMERIAPTMRNTRILPFNLLVILLTCFRLD